MLDKQRDQLIRHAFQQAGIITPESDLTAEEIDEAAYNLNCMLASWNNDGFRLFKIKDAYMPFIAHQNEYSLATQAFKEFATSKITSFQKIGATKLKVSSVAGASIGHSVILLNNTFSAKNTIKDIDYDNAIVMFENPVNMPVYSGDVAFYGDFNTAETTVQEFLASFSSIGFSKYAVAPVVGNSLYLSYNNNWVKVTVSAVDTINNTVSFVPALPAGSVTNSHIVFGSVLQIASILENAGVTPRKLTTEAFSFSPVSIGVPADDTVGALVDVESGNSTNTEFILKEPLSESTLKLLGKEQIIASKHFASEDILSWSDLIGGIPTTDLDWGHVNETAIEFNDWGYVTDPVTTLQDWGTLVGGTAEVVSFAESAGIQYVVAKDENSSVLLYRSQGSDWAEIDIESFNFNAPKLFMAKGLVYIYDDVAGVYSLSDTTILPLYTTNGVEAIIPFADAFYLISGATASNQRYITSTSDFASFATRWVSVLESIANPAEFMGKMYIGKTETYVSLDMKTFSPIGVYSENRCVVGDRLMNLNIEQVCSYTLDGVHFEPMPMTLSNQSAWGYIAGCSFIAIYGVLVDGVMGTEIFTANDFNPVWTPQTRVMGRVHTIFFNDNKAYFVSDVAVKRLDYDIDTVPQDNVAYGFGEQIGRPQEVMNVVKYGIDNQVQLPMDAISLKDYSQLPHVKADGEPVSYCFFKDAIDGKMMVWGTPRKFGEYLKFSYVEPLSLLEGQRSIPDFPDEYVEAVIDGLSVDLGYHYGIPTDRLKALEAKAEDSKEKAMLHDNEDTSYRISPNQRGL